MNATLSGSACRANQLLPLSLREDIQHEAVVLLEGATPEEVYRKHRKLAQELVDQGSLGSIDDLPLPHYIIG